MDHEGQTTDYFAKVRRAYPMTLLGPTFAKQVDRAELEKLGATNVEEVNGSLIFDAHPEIIPAWSPEYLAATTALRRYLWSLTVQNPADDPDPKPVKGKLPRAE